MAFECRQCGECCCFMGQVYEVERESGEMVTVRNRYTGERYLVEIVPDFFNLVADRSFFIENPEACPFVRQERDGKTVCIVHPSRPDICREFSCWRLLILSPDGRRAGRVILKRTLISDDRDLLRLWDQAAGTLQITDDSIWEQEMILILTLSGYSVKK